MSNYRIIIAGSREFDDYNMLKEKVDEFLLQIGVNHNDTVTIVSGTAAGADTLGERYAEEKGYLLTKFPARWGIYGKRAGAIRNEEMAKYADHLIAFWDGKSRGTKNMIDLAREYELQNIKVYDFVDGELVIYETL